MGDFSKDFNSHDNFYYVVNGELKSLGEIDSITFELSEEDSAKLWALCEGLEIVDRI